MSVKTRRKSRRVRRPSPPPAPQKESSDLVSVVGAGNDGSKQKTRIRKGNTNKLVNILQDQLEFVQFRDPGWVTQHYTLTVSDQNVKVKKLLNNKLT